MNGHWENSVGCEWKSQRPVAVADFNDGHGGYTTEACLLVRNGSTLGNAACNWVAWSENFLTCAKRQPGVMSPTSISEIIHITERWWIHLLTNDNVNILPKATWTSYQYNVNIFLQLTTWTSKSYATSVPTPTHIIFCTDSNCYFTVTHIIFVYGTWI